MESKCHTFFSKAKIHVFKKIYIYTKAFLLHLIKTWERTLKKDGEIGEHKLNEMGALDMKYKKWNKLDKSKDHHIFHLFLNMTAH